MTSSAPNTFNKSVVLTVDSESYSLATVDLAVNMAASLKTQLQGLFIEDEDLVRVAELPFTREITFPSALVRSTDATIMQRSLRVVADKFKQHLAKSAQASKVPWTYDYVRGSSQHIGLIANPDVAYTIVAKAIYRRPKPLNYQRPRKLLVVENHSQHLYNALDVVVRSFGDQAVQVVLIKKSPDSPVDEAILKHPSLASKTNIKVMAFERNQMAQILSNASTTFDYSIVSRQEPVESLNEMFKLLRCPIVLVS